MQQRQPMVYLVDDDETVCLALGLLIEAEGLPVERFTSAEAFLQAFPSDAPGCLVLDLHMPDLDGLGLQRALADKHPHLSVVFISGGSDVASTAMAFRGGAADFFEKPVDTGAFLKRIKECLETSQRKRDKASRLKQARAGFSQLTPREKEVVSLVIAGKSSKEIARELGISFRTVEIHRSHLMQKLGVTSLTELINKAWGCAEFCDNNPESGNCRTPGVCLDAE